KDVEEWRSRRRVHEDRTGVLYLVIKNEGELVAHDEQLGAGWRPEGVAVRLLPDHLPFGLQFLQFDLRIGFRVGRANRDFLGRRHRIAHRPTPAQGAIEGHEGFGSGKRSWLA